MERDVQEEMGRIGEIERLNREVERLHHELAHEKRLRALAESASHSPSITSSDVQLKLLADSLPMGMLYQLVIEPDGNWRFIYVSKGVEHIHGVTVEEVYADPFLLYRQIHEEDLPVLIELEQEAILYNRFFNTEIRFHKPDGSIGWVYLTSTPRAYSNGATIWDGIEIDITERKRSSEVFHQQSDEVRWLMKSMANAFVAWGMLFDESGNVADIRFDYFNDAYEKVSKLSLTEVQGKTVRNVWPDTEESWYQTYGEVAISGVSKYFEMFHAPTNGLYACTAYRPGTSRERVCCVFEDITERKKAAEALRDSKAFLDAVIEQSPHSMYVANEKGVMIWMNQACRDLFHVTDEQLIGKYCFLEDNIVAEQGLLPLVKEVYENKKTVHFTLDYDSSKLDTISIAKPSHLILEITIAPVLDSQNRVTHAIVQHLDITERRNAEHEHAKLQEQLQQAMKMEAIGRLAGGIAHDFNNLLTAIIGNVEMAQLQINASSPLYQSLEEIGKAAESAASLTRQLLAFSRKQIIEPQVLNLNELISNLRKMLARLIGEDVILETILAKQLGSIKIDPGQFEQVIVNLAVNARDSMPNGGRLQIETANIELDQDYCDHHAGTQPGAYVLLAVSDTGHGMSPEIKARIFEPFFTTKPKGHGTGLGLATIFGAVKQAGGSIEVYSEVNMGATFKIYLPRIDEAPEHLLKDKNDRLPHQGHETVLLVEDEDSVRQMAVKLLNRLGYHVMYAANGAEALELVGHYHEPIDLLMTDVVMPGINGRELAEKLVLLHPEMKVLYASGYTENVIVHHGVVDSSLNFIGKPYNLGTLSRKIRMVLDGGNAAT